MSVRHTRGNRVKGAARSRVKGSTKAEERPRAVPAELLELIEISRAAGADPDLVQGGGGNTSVKTRDQKRLFIKASGTALGEMDETRGWAELDLEATRKLLHAERLDGLDASDRETEVLRLLEAGVLRPKGARPSVESSLHALLGRVVIHTHPVGLNALLCSRRSREAWREAIGDQHGAPLYVPYVDPGYTLAARVEKEIESYTAEHRKLPSIVLLENHGLFVAADDPAACLELSREITDLGKEWIGGRRVNPLEFSVTLELAGARQNGSGVRVAELRGALLEAGCAPFLLRRDETSTSAEFLAKDGAVALATRGAFTPDQIVYCRTRPLVLEGSSVADWTKKTAAYREDVGLDPRVVIIRPDSRAAVSGGVHYAAPDLGQLRVVSEVYRSAMTAILKSEKCGGPRFLTREQAKFIEGWEVEKFRAALLSGASNRFAGRIGFVTGAGSGLGKAIARGLTSAGATVFALDINRAALEAVRAEMPAGKYLPCAGDVTDEVSIAAAFRALEASAGGIDFLVNAAGIAPSFPLVDFPLGAWRKTLEINLTGYFICAREAARLLMRQGAGGSIINLTSKSGLEASRENSAYNATKAGEIHLMRGWALELGKSGIRVNCVAPGNVFKGSQIWSDEYIRACAKKKGIKPEEVIPYYTSLSPLGKEIEPEDIANAVLFLMSDAARNITGQTLVVDGGQVMVR